MTEFLYPASATAVLGLLIAVPTDHRGRGRHISRRIARLARLDKHGVMAVQTVWLFAEVAAAIIVGPVLPVVAMTVVLVAWLVDDWLTGGDEGPKRKHEWARIKLRMPKPVKLRPIERVPVPA